MADLSMNSLSDKITNFKIKPIEGLTQIQLSNKDVLFVIADYEPGLGRGFTYGSDLAFKDIRFNPDDDVIEIILE